MDNERALGKIYSNIDKLLDDYEDLPETKEAEKRFWEYVQGHIFAEEGEVNEVDLEDVLYDVTFFNQKQGFIYGFNYALELLGKL